MSNYMSFPEKFATELKHIVPALNVIWDVGACNMLGI